MATERSPDVFLLLEDYGRSLRRRISSQNVPKLPASDRPFLIAVQDFPARVRWQGRQSPDRAVIGPSPVPPPELVPSRLSPAERYREAPGQGAWPPDEETSLDLSAARPSSPYYAWGVSVVLHAVGALFVLIPGTMQIDMQKPPDWDAVQITLVTPSLDDLPPLDGTDEIPGDGEGGFRGLEQPSLEPEPGIDAEVEEPVEEDDPGAVPQPLEPPEPEITEEPPAIEMEPEPFVAQAPVAQSPDPGEFQSGREFASSSDPRLLPMPKAPSRSRAALRLEDPKARMPSRPGSAQLGTLELTSRPDQVIEGAIQQMMRGGGGRQAVGDGVGGARSAAVVPSGPSNSGSVVELLSDPRGVDFRPYLTQILANVRRNWFAVIPESARLGMSRGRTLIQFSVARNGSVPKLVIAKSSGAASLDRAAVAGISASNPFPPLPNEYLGGDIRLQFTFLYNIGSP